MKFILTQREIHLGFIKETFRAGTVIEYDGNTHSLFIDGRKFDDKRDFELLQRQAAKYPENPFMVPYTDESYEKFNSLRAAAERKRELEKPKSSQDHMKVVESDRDDIPDIDISHTKANKKEEVSKSNELPVIRGDETLEERYKIAAEAKSGDGVARGLPVVVDDSLGQDGGSAASALNAGIKIPSREEVESKDASAISAARKAEIERNRQAAGIEESAEAVESASDRVARLRAELEAAEAEVSQASDGVERVPVSEES